MRHFTVLVQPDQLGGFLDFREQHPNITDTHPHTTRPVPPYYDHVYSLAADFDIKKILRDKGIRCIELLGDEQLMAVVRTLSNIYPAHRMI